MLANKTPLTELLRTIPIEQRLVFEPDKFHSTNWPIGAMCHEAADRIRELEAAIREATGACPERDTLEPCLSDWCLVLRTALLEKLV